MWDRSIPLFYYCSDDYSLYAGWGGERMVEAERRVIQSATHCFFVSQTLANRAVNRYAVPAERVSVSPNATSVDFLRPVRPERIAEVLNHLPEIQRPIVGVIGAINDRLDIDLLLKCASLPTLGALLLIGPFVGKNSDLLLRRLQRHPRCVLVGARPHDELPAWMQALDVALIPYRTSAFNEACSPMRLFDHLAAGRPIVATTACAQVGEFAGPVRIGATHDEVLSLITSEIDHAPDAGHAELLRSIAQANTWSVRAEKICRIMARCAEIQVA